MSNAPTFPFSNTESIPDDVMGRLCIGKATSGDQLIVWNALRQSQESSFGAPFGTAEKLMRVIADIAKHLGIIPDDASQISDIQCLVLLGNIERMAATQADDTLEQKYVEAAEERDHLRSALAQTSRDTV